MRQKRRRKSLFLRRALLLAAAAVLIGVSVRAAPLAGRWAVSAVSAVFTSVEESKTLSRDLAALAQEEPRAQAILENRSAYPDDLLSMLCRNPEMLDFVLGYPEHRGETLGDSVGETAKGTFPLLLQYDPRWGYAAYADNIVAVNGCGPTCLSMAIAGLTGEDVTPAAVADYAAREGYYAAGQGTSWSLMAEGCAAFGLAGKELPLSQGVMEKALREGAVIVCSMGPGDFTTCGHFILITGAADGGFSVNDPNSSERSARLWEYDTLAPQIKNLWALRAA